MKKTILSLLAIATIISYTSCKDDESTTTPDDKTGTTDELHSAFGEFSDNVTVTRSNGEVTIISNGYPDHKSPYWSNTTERTINGPMGEHTTKAAAENHALFEEPTVTSYNQMAPGNIDDFNGSYSLTVSETPTKASSTSSTGLGAIGIARSGGMIYNDEEGPNVPLDDAVGSLDKSGAHTGPQSYHYHLEPKHWSEDDDKLIGIISDGFFLYGRKCNSTGAYPTDLDASGGHTSTTQHTTDAEYHYHIQNDLYLGSYYILFPGDYQGSASSIR